jgi:hypothetical protein
VRRAIVTGELEHGARASEASLAETLGVSWGRVRDATRVLGQEGLPPQGASATTVAGCAPGDIEQLFDQRAHLEAYAIRLAAPGHQKILRYLLEGDALSAGATLRRQIRGAAVQVVADSAYGTAENVRLLEEAGIRAYVPLRDLWGTKTQSLRRRRGRTRGVGHQAGRYGAPRRCGRLLGTAIRAVDATRVCGADGPRCSGRRTRAAPGASAAYR